NARDVCLIDAGAMCFRREHFCHSERKCQSGSDRGISNSFLVTWGLSPSLEIKKIRRRRQNVDSCEQNARATLTNARALSPANLPPESRPGSPAKAADYGRRNDCL